MATRGGATDFLVIFVTFRGLGQNLAGRSCTFFAWATHHPHPTPRDDVSRKFSRISRDGGF